MANDEMETRAVIVAAAVRAAILAKAPRRTIAAVAAAVTSAPFCRPTSGSVPANAPGGPARTPRPRERQELAPQALGESAFDQVTFAVQHEPVHARRRRGRRGARGRDRRSGGANALRQDCLTIGAQPALTESPAAAEVDEEMARCMGNEEVSVDACAEQDDEVRGDREQLTRRCLRQDGVASGNDVMDSSFASDLPPSPGSGSPELAIGTLVSVIGLEGSGVEFNGCFGLVEDAIDAEGRLGVRLDFDRGRIDVKRINLVAHMLQ